MNPFYLQSLFSLNISGSYGGNILGIVLYAGPVVKFVLLLLLMFSVISWAIIIMKIILIRRTRRESETFFNIYYGSKRLSSIYAETKEMRRNPFAAIFRESCIELNRISKSNPVGGEGPLLGTELPGLESIERTLKRTATSELNRYERALAFLATTGSTTPFIGLFGTVWGIMDAFRSIGIRGSASLAVVAPGIAEALIATAAGLAAAIPAVVAYNYFVSRIKEIASELDNFSSEFLNVIHRHFMQQPGG
jgi:biopolymer transport protein TolQ